MSLVRFQHCTPRRKKCRCHVDSMRCNLQAGCEQSMLPLRVLWQWRSILGTLFRGSAPSRLALTPVDLDAFQANLGPFSKAILIANPRLILILGASRLDAIL